MAIQFTAHDHKYQSVNAEESIDWLSVTSFVKLFKEPFDQKEVALKASQNAKSKWYGMDPEHIIKIWNNETDRAVTLGSWYHDQRETEVVMCDTIRRAGMDLPIIRPIEQNGVKIAPDQNLTEGIYPEHMVYLKSAGICGQADRV
jgi:endonuclease I